MFMKLWLWFFLTQVVISYFQGIKFAIDIHMPGTSMTVPFPSFLFPVLLQTSSWFWEPNVVVTVRPDLANLLSHFVSFSVSPPFPSPIGSKFSLIPELFGESPYLKLAGAEKIKNLISDEYLYQTCWYYRPFNPKRPGLLRGVLFREIKLYNIKFSFKWRSKYFIWKMRCSASVWHNDECF